jgi:hypothetical protein
VGRRASQRTPGRGARAPREPLDRAGTRRVLRGCTVRAARRSDGSRRHPGGTANPVRVRTMRDRSRIRWRHVCGGHGRRKVAANCERGASTLTAARQRPTQFGDARSWSVDGGGTPTVSRRAQSLRPRDRRASALTMAGPRRSTTRCSRCSTTIRGGSDCRKATTRSLSPVARRFSLLRGTPTRICAIRDARIRSIRLPTQ